ncbi:MAG: hypothetical protein EXS35_13000 [Pedosphaera sp.]|nr:hypothetical protein [Pedosphaera sp.]
MNRRFAALLWVVTILASKPVLAVSPWPAETSGAALKLTALDAEFTSDMSGAYWNATSNTFWVCCNNPGTFWALRQDAAGNWQIATNASGTQARWAAGGDLEGICQANDSSPTVYLMDEDGWIRQYDTAIYGVVNQTRSWDIRTYCPEVNGAGPEAITFVPDDWLRREGFRDNSGALRNSSNGMGGLMFVGSQIGGYVHVFDLNTNANTFTYCGSNQTARAETADLAFDHVTGKLYIWHNTGANYLEVAELNSTTNGGIRRLRTLIEYTGPRTGNLEGFALVSTPETNDWCMVTDDSNANGEGVVLYRQFRPNEDTDNDGLPDDWELRYFGSTAITDGHADFDGDGKSDFDEFRAGTDPTNALSLLRIRSLTPDGTNVLINWQTGGGRTNIVQSTSNLTGAFSDRSPPIIIPGSGDALASYLDYGGGTNSKARFYRVRTAP